MATRKVMIGFKADVEVRTQLEQIAEIEDRSISYLVNKFVKQGIENYLSSRGEEGNRALEVMTYIEELDFTSYSDFLRITAEQNTYEWITDELGALQTYMVVCDKLGILADENTITSIEMNDLLEDEEEVIDD